MIHLRLTLHRFICEVDIFTGIFELNEEGDYIPDTAGFLCGWSPVPRHTSVNPAAVPLTGHTNATFFRSSNGGKDMVLVFNSEEHTLSLDSKETVLSFILKPTEFSNGEIPVIAKGTLDPEPYQGRAKKNYAIKLRDATGHVVGKLLFSLEIDSTPPRVEEESRTEKESATSCQTPPREPHKAPSLEPTPSPRLPQRSSPPERTLPVGGPSASSSTSPPPERALTAVRSSTPRESRERVLEIMLEQVVVKSNSLDLNHPAPFHLGGSYYMKLKYASHVFTTTTVMCHSPKDIQFPYDKTTFPLQPPGVEKIKFSLWENNRQVAGFSLNPSKFKVEPNMYKEYSIPFRYLPTRQNCSLEVTVSPSERSPEGAAGSRSPFTSKPFQQECQEILELLQPEKPKPPLQTSTEAPRKASPPRYVNPSSEGSLLEQEKHPSETRSKLPTRREPHVPPQMAAPAPHPLEPTSPAPAPPSVSVKRPPSPQGLPSKSVSVLPSRKEFLLHRRGPSPSPVNPAPVGSSALPIRAPPTLHPAPLIPVMAETVVHHPPSPPPAPLDTFKFPISPSGSLTTAPTAPPVSLGTPTRNDSLRRRSPPSRPRLSDSPTVSLTAVKEAKPTPHTTTTTKALSSSSAVDPSADPHVAYLNEVMRRLDQLDQKREKGNLRSSLVNEWSAWKDERINSRSSSVNSSLPRGHSVNSSVMSRADSVSSISSRRASPLPTKSNVSHSELKPYQTNFQPHSRDNSVTRRRL